MSPRTCTASPGSRICLGNRSGGPWLGPTHDGDRGPCGYQWLVRSLVLKEKSTYRTTGDLIRLSIMRLVIASLTIPHHSHDVRKSNPRTIILVSVKEDTETLESIRGTENGTLRGTLLGEPQGKTVTVQITGSMNLELKLDLVLTSH